MMDFLEPISILGQTASGGPGNMVADLAGKFGVNWKMLAAQTVNFLIVAYLLHRFAFKPILNTLNERQKRIADGLSYADKMESTLKNAQAQKEDLLKEAALEAKERIDEARQQAKSYIEEQTQEAVRKAEEILIKAEKAVQLEREKMLQNVQAELINCVVDTTEKVLSKHLSVEEKKHFSELADKQIEAVKL